MADTIINGTVGVVNYPTSTATGGVADTNMNIQSWRKAAMRPMFQGDMPLLALTSQAKREPVTSDFHNWLIEMPSTLNASFTATEVYTNAGLGTKIAAQKTAGTVYYIKLAEAYASRFVVGMVISLRSTTDSTVGTNAQITAVNLNGASSFLAASILDTDPTASLACVKANTITAIGSANAEYGSAPDGITTFASVYQNYVQTFWNTYKISEKEDNTETRMSENERLRRKMNCFSEHGKGIENALWLGQKSIITDAAGQRAYTFDGLFKWITSNAPQNVFDYRVTSATNGWTAPASTTTFKSGGEAFIDLVVQKYSKYSLGGTPIIIGGAGALAGLNAVATAGSTMQVVPGQKEYGLNVHKWISPFGEFAVKTAPMFTNNPVLNYSMVFLVPKNVKVMPFKNLDTKHVQEKTTPSSYEEWGYRTSITVEYAPAELFAVCHGVGLPVP